LLLAYKLGLEVLFFLIIREKELKKIGWHSTHQFLELDFQRKVCVSFKNGRSILAYSSILLVLLFCFSISDLQATEIQDNASQNISPTIPKIIQRDSDFIISAPTLKEELQQNKTVLLVDVRRAEEFEKSRIPNTLNIPLHKVKTKIFLKNLDFVLINAGSNYRTLEEEAARLKSQGFIKVKVLTGGMSAWQDADGRVDGDPDSLSKLNEISPRDFNVDSIYDDWILLNTSKVKPVEKDSVFSQASYVPFNDNRDDFVKQVQSALVARDDIPLPFILIFNMNGEYGHIKYALRNTELINVFYLKGGTAAYQDFLKKQEMMLNPGGKKSTQCETCPQ
jgi:rhodanese-related sulfurtransferase